MHDDDEEVFTVRTRPYDGSTSFGALLRFIRMSRPFGLCTVAFGTEDSYRRLAELIAGNGDIARADIPRFVAELQEHSTPVHSFDGSAMYEYIATGPKPSAGAPLAVPAPPSKG